MQKIATARAVVLAIGLLVAVAFAMSEDPDPADCEWAEQQLARLEALKGRGLLESQDRAYMESLARELKHCGAR